MSPAALLQTEFKVKFHSMSSRDILLPGAGPGRRPLRGDRLERLLLPGRHLLRPHLAGVPGALQGIQRAVGPTAKTQVFNFELGKG